MIAIPAAGNASHVGVFEARTADLLEGNARQILGVVIEITNTELFEPRGAESLNTQGHIL